jgi:hypothetical protein
VAKWLSQKSLLRHDKFEVPSGESYNATAQPAVASGVSVFAGLRIDQTIAIPTFWMWSKNVAIKKIDKCGFKRKAVCVDAKDGHQIGHWSLNIWTAVNIDLQRQVTTHHHLNPVIIAKYRTVDWIFAVYSGIELIAIYFMTPKDLEPLFTKWEKDWHDRGGRDINNPKIPLDFAVARGKLLHGNPPPPKARKKVVVIGDEKEDAE